MKINSIAETALSQMLSAGFDEVQVTASITEQDELNIAHNEASLLRSTEDYSLSLLGIVDGRKATTAVTDLESDAVAESIKQLYERAQLAPQDDANRVSADQTGHFEQGPLQCDLSLLTAKVKELLEYRQNETPLMNIDEGGGSHARSQEVLLTSRGSRITSDIGCYEMMVMGTATEGDQSSSFNYTGGTTNHLSGTHAAELFGIGTLLEETQRQIHTRSFEDKFQGSIILAPTAVMDLLDWLLGQIGDGALISNSSLFADQVGNVIASPELSIRSRFDGPGRAAYTADGFVAPPLGLVQAGKLTTLTPSYYGSRKTGINHRPCASGWMIDPGETALADMISDIKKGAMVNRLSMGSPGPNGDFSGVIKNSFMIENGQLTDALSETMIAGNMAVMLRDISRISSEHLDLGSQDFPWLTIDNLHFS